MIPTQEFVDYKVWGDGASVEMIKEPPASKYSAGFIPGEVFPAQWENYFLNKQTSAITALNAGMASVEAEINCLLFHAGIEPAEETPDQLYNAVKWQLDNRLSNATPKDLGTASAGESSKYARADHVHTLPSKISAAQNLIDVMYTTDNRKFNLFFYNAAAYTTEESMKGVNFTPRKNSTLTYNPATNILDTNISGISAQTTKLKDAAHGWTASELYEWIATGNCGFVERAKRADAVCTELGSGDNCRAIVFKNCTCAFSNGNTSLVYDTCFYYNPGTHHLGLRGDASICGIDAINSAYAEQLKVIRRAAGGDSVTCYCGGANGTIGYGATGFNCSCEFIIRNGTNYNCTWSIDKNGIFNGKACTVVYYEYSEFNNLFTFDGTKWNNKTGRPLIGVADVRYAFDSRSECSDKTFIFIPKNGSIKEEAGIHNAGFFIM